MNHMENFRLIAVVSVLFFFCEIHQPVYAFISWTICVKTSGLSKWVSSYCKVLRIYFSRIIHLTFLKAVMNFKHLRVVLFHYITFWKGDVLWINVKIIFKSCPIQYLNWEENNNKFLVIKRRVQNHYIYFSTLLEVLISFLKI